MCYEEKNISKRNVVFVLLSTVCILIIFSMIVHNSFTTKKIIYDGFKNMDNNTVKYCIDSQKYDKNTDFITINGWAFVEGDTIKTYECHVVLKDNTTNEYIKLPTKLVTRQDVTAAFKDSKAEFNYDKSGFEAKLKLDELKNPLENYEVYLDYSNNNANKLVKTAILLTKGGCN